MPVSWKLKCLTHWRGLGERTRLGSRSIYTFYFYLGPSQGGAISLKNRRQVIFWAKTLASSDFWCEALGASQSYTVGNTWVKTCDLRLSVKHEGLHSLSIGLGLWSTWCFTDNQRAQDLMSDNLCSPIIGEAHGASLTHRTFTRNRRLQVFPGWPLAAASGRKYKTILNPQEANWRQL